MIYLRFCVLIATNFVSAARTAPSIGGTPNNLPPLSFHSVHGENVRISRDGSIARRVESFCKGIAFSARPVRVNERVGGNDFLQNVDKFSLHPQKSAVKIRNSFPFVMWIHRLVFCVFLVQYEYVNVYF